jgi:hypothetical protein
MKLGIEDISLITVMEWVRYNGYQDFIWHVANERAINPYSGSIL